MMRSAASAIFLLCVFRLATADLDIVPENHAVVGGIGSTVVLTCRSTTPTPTARILWTEFASTSLGSVVSDNRGVVPSHPNAARYSVIGSIEGNEFHLQISNVVAADGGTYMCQDVNSAPPATFRGFADLVVLESEPSCTDYATGDGIVIDGVQYAAECNVNYRGNIAPRFQWFGPNGFFVQNGTNPPNAVWSYMWFTANRELDAQVFFHQTNFTEVMSQPGYASNAPNYTHFHYGPALDICWPPNQMSIDLIKMFYEVGDVITCSADSKPAAAHQWYNMRTLLPAAPGPSFTVTADLLGTEQMMRCNAAVNIGGSLYTNDLFINVNVPQLTTTPIPTTTGPTTPPPADGPCYNLNGRWQSTMPSATICITMDNKGNLFIIIRNGTDFVFVPGTGKTVYDDYRHVGFTAQWPNTGVGGFAGECHNCFGTEVLLMSGLSRNKFSHDVCGESGGTQLTNIYVFTRIGPQCLGMEVDEVATNNQEWIIEKMGVKAKKITKF